MAEKGEERDVIQHVHLYVCIYMYIPDYIYIMYNI